MAVYLKSLPMEPPRPRPSVPPADPARVVQGGKLYDDHCAACHGSSGEGGVTADGRRVVPPLAGNRSVTMEPPANVVRAIALGGFGPATAGHPRPYGMPPYTHLLSDDQIGAVATFLRASWGAQASPVSSFDVGRYRGGSED
jgi:mono/diheme cytochrome c family protein